MIRVLVSKGFITQNSWYHMGRNKLCIRFSVEALPLAAPARK
jgi:hypothetical protein